MHKTLYPGEVARLALEKVLDSTGAAGGYVKILQGEERRTWFSETAEAPGHGSDPPVIPDDEVVATVLREGSAVHFDCRSLDGTVGRKRPAVAVPIVAGGAVTGVLTVIGWPGNRQFKVQTAAFLTVLGTVLGQALQNALCYQRQEMKLSMVESLIKLRQALSATHEEEKVLNMVMADVQDFLGVQWCVLRLLDKKTGELVVASASGLSAEIREIANRILPEGGLLGAAIQKGEVVAVEDLAAADSDLRLPYYASDMRAIAVAPIVAGREVLGTLKAYTPMPRRWSENELNFLAAVAGLLGLTLADLHLHASLRQQFWKVIHSLTAALEAKDEYTRGHTQRVARFALACGRALGLTKEQQEHLWQAAAVHDIGKIGVSDSVLLKPGRLNQAEWEKIRYHSVAGANIVKEGGLPEAVLLGVRHHHEDWNGAGYPDGLAREGIPLLARVIRVADAYDAMTTDRLYRKKIMAAEALERLRRGAGHQFDPGVVAAFLIIPASEMAEIEWRKWPWSPYA